MAKANAGVRAVCLAVFAAASAMPQIGFGQEATPAANPAPPAVPAGAAPMPRLVPVVDYSGGFFERPALTGDWGGVRQDLMDKGVRFDGNYTSVGQRNVAGGLSQACTYRGALDLTLSIDTHYLGLWPGGLLKTRAQGGWGQGDNGRAGSIMPVDTNGLYPIPGEDSFVVAEVNYTQFVSPQLGFTLGKYQPRDPNPFANDPTEHFLNAALNFNPVIGTTTPLNFLGAGVIFIPVDGLMFTTLALDTEGSAGTTGFDTVFEGGTSVMQTAELRVTPFGLTGHQRVGFQWTDKVRTALDPTPRLIFQALRDGSTEPLDSESGNWSLTYDFDQYIYRVPGATDGGVGVFGRVGYSDSSVNPVAGFYSLGVVGKGLFSGRPRDSFGVAFYYVELYNDLPRALEERSDDEYGAEFFYNVAVTPWFHVSPDIQVINPGRSNVDTTVVLGLRARLDF